MDYLGGGGAAVQIMPARRSTFYSPIPLEFRFPPGCTVEVIDNAAISTTDTCQINAVS